MGTRHRMLAMQITTEDTEKITKWPEVCVIGERAMKGEWESTFSVLGGLGDPVLLLVTYMEAGGAAAELPGPPAPQMESSSGIASWNLVPCHGEVPVVSPVTEQSASWPWRVKIWSWNALTWWFLEHNFPITMWSLNSVTVSPRGIFCHISILQS